MGNPQPYPAPGNGEREWWAQRWIDVLESFGWRRRLERARNYAREGRVLSLDFDGPTVRAKVQGTATKPYKVSLALDPFDDEQWSYAIEEMSQRAIFAAKLLAGEMPHNIEEAFTASGLSLFPFSKFDIHSRCSCPDPVNPCKHIGAVYYLLGDYFSQDPFILFQLRGRTQPEIIEALRDIRSRCAPDEATIEVPQHQPPSLHIQADFWRYDHQLDPSLVVIAPPPSQETILDVLGPIATESPASAIGSRTSSQALMESLKMVYQQASQQALIMAMRNQQS
ncbi:metal-binding protein [Synechococcales cyanobacterium C]|uniref:Metal-binding protein n=1 Tax=Petrachloros mirabilis ULC683 TaxID=2781853 RepID=A0A8K2A054_9CYAN|nr:metal-binding protein [Petrachloros mirabilis ULC683]